MAFDNVDEEIHEFYVAAYRYILGTLNLYLEFNRNFNNLLVRQMILAKERQV